ncbi:MAG: MlaC/ttg2D family ABC transporter substrate-binding protein [Steroidobacteraceae bacterium]
MRRLTGRLLPMRSLVFGLALAAGAALTVTPGIATAAAQAGGGTAVGGATGAQPSQIVENVAQRFLKDVDANRSQYSKDPKALRAAVNRDVLPYFDVQFSARLVLGRYWRTATPQQRQRFIDAFENSMFDNYGSALLGFRTNRLHVVPTTVNPNATNALVRTQIHRDDGSSVDVNFALHKTASGWKAWDVVIEGISYVKSFRDDFGAQIQAQGVDSVIQRLERGEKPAQLPNPGARKS